jgi:hypothetical protein
MVFPFPSVIQFTGVDFSAEQEVPSSLWTERCWQRARFRAAQICCPPYIPLTDLFRRYRSGKGDFSWQNRASNWCRRPSKIGQFDFSAGLMPSFEPRTSDSERSRVARRCRQGQSPRSPGRDNDLAVLPTRPSARTGASHGAPRHAWRTTKKAPPPAGALSHLMVCRRRQIWKHQGHSYRRNRCEHQHSDQPEIQLGHPSDSCRRSSSLEKRSFPDIGTPLVLKTCPIL